MSWRPLPIWELCSREQSCVPALLTPLTSAAPLPPKVQWFPRRIHKAQHIAVLMADNYCTNTVRIHSWMREGERRHIRLFVEESTRSSSMLLLKVLHQVCSPQKLNNTCTIFFSGKSTWDRIQGVLGGIVT